MGKIAEKINGFIEEIGIDKVLHFLVGYAIVVTGLIYSFAAGLWCFLAVVAMSIAKEYLIDKKTDWQDIFAGSIGGMLGIFAYIPKDYFSL